MLRGFQPERIPLRLATQRLGDFCYLIAKALVLSREPVRQQFFEGGLNNIAAKRYCSE
jgi:hypothetical protein